MVIVIVPVTAIPKAKASAADDSKVKTRVSTETSSSQLMNGT